MVDREAKMLENPWLSPAGLGLQAQALDEVWSDSALDVYDDL